MPETNQTSGEQTETPSPKKRWETPKLSKLDIKASTLGGATAAVNEDAKNFPMS